MQWRGMSVRYILGVDGGGSKTYAVVVNERGKRLGTGVAGCGNHQGPGIEVALNNIRAAIDTAMSAARLEPEDIDFAMYGLAGADRPKDFSILRPALATLPYENWDVVCDTLEGLRTGTEDNVGVVLVCGSGTNAMGRNPRGDTIQTGGMGTLFGDAAGGHYMAYQTFRAAMRSWEHREPDSILTELVAEHLGFADMEEIFNHYLDHDINYVPRDLAVVLHRAADAGDALAVRLLRETGHELGLAANSVIRRLGGFDDIVIPIVLVGSVVQKGKNPHLLSAIADVVQPEHPLMELRIPELAPVYGSVLLGMDHLGIPTDENMVYQFIRYGGYAD